MIIAVDFDGTIVEHKYPAIGKEIPFAIETLKKLQQERHFLILWSVREGRLLEEAVEFCRQRGLEFYAVNSNYAEEKDKSRYYSRKLKADLFIDDRNLGGLPDWGVIYEMVHNRLSYEQVYQNLHNEKRPAPKGFWARLSNNRKGVLLFFTQRKDKFQPPTGIILGKDSPAMQNDCVFYNGKSESCAA